MSKENMSVDDALTQKEGPSEAFVEAVRIACDTELDKKYMCNFPICDCQKFPRAISAAIEIMQKATGGSPRGKATPTARSEALEEAARVAENAIGAGERVREEMTPQSPMDGLADALHEIVVTTARGIARNIRRLKDTKHE